MAANHSTTSDEWNRILHSSLADFASLPPQKLQRLAQEQSQEWQRKCLDSMAALLKAHSGVSVTQRIKGIKGTVNPIGQPYGGFLPVKTMEKVILSDQKPPFDHTQEQPSAGTIGTAVDYLTRFNLTQDAQASFHISLLGANRLEKIPMAEDLLANLHGLDDTSIKAALRLAGFDVAYRAGLAGYRPVEDMVISTEAVANIRWMVERSLFFFEKYGPIVCDEPTFSPDGYTRIVWYGDGDFTTATTMWDFKTSIKPPTSAHTLQLLMYWIMARMSGQEQYNTLTSIGIYNPRMDTVWQYHLDPANPEDVERIRNVRDYVLGY